MYLARNSQLKAERPAAGRAAARPLGALRFGLAVLVTAQHFQHLLPVPRRAVFDHGGFGAVAVAVFFTLSGFVVAEANALFYAGRPGAFLANRLLRLAPPYAAALALSVCVHAALARAGALRLWDYAATPAPLSWAHLASGALGLVPGLHLAVADPFEFIPFAWSLRAEMAFYAALAAVLLLAGRAGRALVPACMIGVLAGCALLLRPGHPSLLSCAPMFLLGAGFYLARRGAAGARRVFWVLCLPVAGLGFASWVQHGHPYLTAQLALCGALLLLAAWLARRRVPARLAAWDRVLGDLSYPLYLNHYAVGLVFTALLPRGAAAYAAGLAVSVLVAWAMMRAVDRPMRRLRDRVRGVGV